MKPKKSQDPQRLSGLTPSGDAIVRTISKDIEEGITRPPALLKSKVIKVTECRETQDVLQRDNLEATASVVNCVNGANGDVPCEMNLTDVDDIVSVLQQNDGEFIMVKIPGEDRYATSPVGDAYGCMLTARMIPVLNNIDGFIRKQFYPNVDKTLSCEWGAVNNTRFFISSQGSVSANASLLGNDIANCFVTAKEGYKVVRDMPDDPKSSLISWKPKAYGYGDKVQATERWAA